MAVNRDFQCVCGWVTERKADPDAVVTCDKCGLRMRPIITLRKVQAPTDALWPMVHSNLGHAPVEVKSWGHFRSLLKERNMSNPLM